MNSYLYYLDTEDFGYEGKEEKQEREEDIANGKEFELIVTTSQMENVKDKINLLKQKYPNAQIEIRLNINKGYIYEESEMKALEDIDKLCTNKNIKLYISLGTFVGGEYQNLLMARNQIEELKQKVNNFTYEENGKQAKLSPYEKFLIVYKFVANRVYNMSEDFGDLTMRNWVGVLTSDKVICSGFASLLKCVCDQIFTQDELKCYEQASDVYELDGKSSEGHANNLIIINDPKYNLNGLYYADACWDCKDDSFDNKTTFNYCLIPIQQIMEYKRYNFAFSKNFFIYKNINPYFEYGKSDSDNTFANDIMTRFKFKTEQELINEANIEETVSKKRQEYERKQEQVKQENEKLSQTIDEKLKVFFEKAGFYSVEDFKILSYYPKNFEKKNPLMAEVVQFFNSIESVEDLENEEVIEQVKKYKRIYEDNVLEFKEFNKTWLKETERWDIFKAKEVTLFEKVKNKIFTALKQDEDSEIFSSAVEREKLKEEARRKFDQQIEDCLAVGKDFIYSQPIDDKKFAKGLVAMAKYVGLDEEKIKDWAMAEIKKRAEYKLLNFGEKEVILPSNKEEKQTLDFEF